MLATKSQRPWRRHTNAVIVVIVTLVLLHGTYQAYNEAADTHDFGDNGFVTSPPPICEGMRTEYPVVPYDIHLRTVVKMPEYAFCTVVTHPYAVPIAAIMFHSLAGTGSQYARCVLVAKRISQSDREYLSLFAQVIEVEPLFPPRPTKHARYDEVFTKFRIFQLAPLYKKIVLIDYDIVVLKNIDDLLDLPVGEENLLFVAARDLFKDIEVNTGLAVMTPSLAFYDEVTKALGEVFDPEIMTSPTQLFLVLFFETIWPQVLRNRGIEINGTNGIISYLPRWYQATMADGGYFNPIYAWRLMYQSRQVLNIFDERPKTTHYLEARRKPWTEGAFNPPIPNIYVNTSYPPDEARVRHSTDVAGNPFDSNMEHHLALRLARWSAAFCDWKEYVRRFPSYTTQRSVHMRVNVNPHPKAMMPSGYTPRETVEEAVAGTLHRSQLSNMTDSELQARIEPIRHFQEFWYYLGYLRMVRIVNKFTKLRRNYASLGVNMSAAKGHFEEGQRFIESGGRLEPLRSNGASASDPAAALPCSVRRRSRAYLRKQRLIADLHVKMNTNYLLYAPALIPPTPPAEVADNSNNNNNNIGGSTGAPLPPIPDPVGDRIRSMRYPYGSSPQDIFRAQITLGAAWGYNEAYAIRRREFRAQPPKAPTRPKTCPTTTAPLPTDAAGVVITPVPTLPPVATFKPVKIMAPQQQEGGMGAHAAAAADAQTTTTTTTVATTPATTAPTEAPKPTAEPKRHPKSSYIRYFRPIELATARLSLILEDWNNAGFGKPARYESTTLSK